MEFEKRVDIFRSFNRFYTKRIGVLHEGLLESEFSLTEARVIFELAQCSDWSASTLGSELGLDAGYMSRIVRKFTDRGLVKTTRSATDGRIRILHLTEKGLKAFKLLNKRSHDEFATMLGTLSDENQNRLINSMQSVRRILENEPTQAPVIIRTLQPGDIGAVTRLHGTLYWQEYRWDETFEALVAGILADFVKNFDTTHERSWIVEMDCRIIGSVFICRRDETTAQLRLLLVSPDARGMGLGSRLVNECIRFSRQAGYQKIMLWTNSVLHAARRIYEKAGFMLVEEEQHHSFGHDLVGQNWELELR